MGEQTLAGLFRVMRGQSVAAPLDGRAAPARNRRCPCGSGRQYKDCCGCLDGTPRVKPRPREPLEQRLRQALVANDRGDLEGAESQLHEVLAAIPNQRQALRTLVAIKRQHDDHQAVAVLLERLLRLYPHDDEALVDRGRFFPDDSELPPFPVTAANIDQANTRVVDAPYNASVYDGRIAVQQTLDGALVPLDALYRVRLRLDSMPAHPQRVQRGRVRLEVDSSNLIERLWRMATAVIIRETGF